LSLSTSLFPAIPSFSLSHSHPGATSTGTAQLFRPVLIFFIILPQRGERACAITQRRERVVHVLLVWFGSWLW